MNFFTLNEASASADVVRRFSGLNLSEKKEPGELAEAKNISLELYPFLSAAKPDVTVKVAGGEYEGMCLLDKIFEVIGSGIISRAYYGGADTGLVMERGKKRLVKMGTKVIIFPDKLWYDTASGESGELEAEYTSQSSVPVRIEVCDIDGATVDCTASQSAPPSAAEGVHWCDTSTNPPTMKVRGEGVWIDAVAAYTKIISPGCGRRFKEGDGVRVKIDSLALGGGFHVVEKAEENFVILPGIYLAPGDYESVNIERKVPVTDFELEAENRIWACRYGLSGDGEFVNEIYASKLGDPTNFECYEGLSSDSYTMTLGSEGKFTGCISHLGNVIFFKEKCFHKIFGRRPADYSLVTVNAEGPLEGCEDSLVASGDLIYYVSRSGITVYDGAFPRTASEKVALLKLEDASAAAHSGKVYFSGRCTSGVPGSSGVTSFLQSGQTSGTNATAALYDAGEQGETGGEQGEAGPGGGQGESARQNLRTFVLDTKYMLWSERDYVPLGGAVSLGDCVLTPFGSRIVLIANPDAAERCEALTGSCAEAPEKVRWSFVTGNLSPVTAEYVYKVLLRLKVFSHSSVSVSAQYEDGGEFRHVGQIRPCVERSYAIPLYTRRTDSFRLRFEGEGDFILYSIARFLDEASENTLYFGEG